MDIAITWPKTRTLESYLTELRKADDNGLLINYRVPTRPKRLVVADRCYMIYDGAVRGWNEVLGVEHRDDVLDPVSGEIMAPGVFIVRNPLWFPIFGPEILMKGFQGYRYVDFPEPISGRYMPSSVYLNDDVQGEPITS